MELLLITWYIYAAFFWPVILFWIALAIGMWLQDNVEITFERNQLGHGIRGITGEELEEIEEATQNLQTPLLT